MRAARQLGSGLFYALISILLVVGGLSLALAENKIASTITSTPGLTSAPQILTSIPVTQPDSSQTLTLTLTPTDTPFPTFTSPVLTNCIPPAGWVFISVQSGQSLSSLASEYHITPEQLTEANCLTSQYLSPGYGVYVPPLTQPANTIISCGPFPGWVRGYIVEPGDTLFHIAVSYRTTVANLQRANCKSNSTIIYAGDRLWVPNVPTVTPGVTYIPPFSTHTEIPTEPLTITPLPFTATILPANTDDQGQSTTP